MKPTKEEKAIWVEDNSVDVEEVITLMGFIKKIYSEKGADGVRKITRPSWISSLRWSEVIDNFLLKKEFGNRVH